MKTIKFEEKSKFDNEKFIKLLKTLSYDIVWENIKNNKNFAVQTNIPTSINLSNQTNTSIQTDYDQNNPEVNEIEDPKVLHLIYQGEH